MKVESNALTDGYLKKDFAFFFKLKGHLYKFARLQRGIISNVNKIKEKVMRQLMEIHPEKRTLKNGTGINECVRFHINYFEGVFK